MRRIARFPWLPAALLLVGLLPTRAHAANAVRISQVYGGGGFTSGTPVPTYQQDYVELYNSSTVPVDIGGWWLEYGSAAGNWGSSAFNRFNFPPGSSIPAKGYVLIALGNVGLGDPLPVVPDFTGPTNLSSISGKLGLFTAEIVNLGCGGEAAVVLDKVAYGSSTCAEGSGAVDTLSRISAAVRKGAGEQDTDDNANDFDVVFNPRPANAPPPSLSAPDSVTATATCATITIRWKPVPDATHYRVYRDGGVDSIEVSVPPAVDPRDTDTAAHTYTVVAFDALGHRGPTSAPATSSTVIPWPPYYTGFSPPLRQVAAGDAVSFQVEGTLLSDSTQFTWLKDDVPIPGAPDGPTLTIPAAALADAGSYRCTMCNRCGCNTTAASVLSVVAVPAAPVGLQATPACGAMTLDWEVVPGADGYRVYRDGGELTGPTGISAPPFVDATATEGAHCYQVAATTGSGAVTGPHSASVCATFAVASPTASGLLSRSIAEGGNVTFTVTTTGAPAQFVWKKNGQPIADAANESSYTITYVRPSDAGGYSVTVSNACGSSTSNVASLSVCAAISMGTLPAKAAAEIGAASCTLSVSVTGATSLRWYRGSQALTESSKYSGTNTSTLVLHDLAVADADWYQLRATGACGSKASSNTCQLQVVPCATPTSITTQPLSLNVIEGDPASFTLVAAGCPPFGYQWQRRVLGRWQNLPGATSATYSIASAVRALQGDYRCVVHGMGLPPVATSNTVRLGRLRPEFLSLSSRPRDCSSATVRWTTNIPTKVTLRYGPSCGALGLADSTTTFATSDSLVVALSSSNSATLRLLAVSAAADATQSDCMTARFSMSPPNLSIRLTPVAGRADLAGTEDALAVNLRVQNSGCQPTSGPVVVTDLHVNGTVPPRHADLTSDLPRLVASGVVAAGGSLESQAPFLFSLAEIARPVGATLYLSGTLRYGVAPPYRFVTFTSKVVMP